MPILAADFLSDWWHLTDRQFGLQATRPIIVKSWDEKTSRDVSKVSLMQSDLGTHVMKIGGFKYTTNISSPILIARQNTISDTGNDIFTPFDIIISNLNIYRDPLSFVNFVNSYNSINNQMYGYYLLKSATINISKGDVSCSLELWSDFPNIFPKELYTPSNYPTFIARTAEWYDTFLYFADSTPGFNNSNSSPYFGIQDRSLYQIEKGTININIDIDEDYYIGQKNDIITGEPRGQVPMFKVKGYDIKADITALIHPEDTILKIIPETPNYFYPGYGLIGINISNKYFNFGEAFNIKSLSRTMASQETSKVSLSIETYANINTNIQVNS